MEESVMYLPNDVFLPLVLDELKLHPDKTATINLRGRSMRPFLEDGRDKAMLQLITGDECCKGDAVLAEIHPGHYVLHRIDAIHTPQGIAVQTATSDPEARITLRGDGNVRGTESCLLRDIRCIATAFERKGKTWHTDTSRFWRIYSRVWPALLPVRRYLLAAYRLLWLHELPQRWAKKKNINHQ